MAGLGAKASAPHNRGIVLDLVVFVVNLLLVRALVMPARSVVHAAQEEQLAKLTVGLFFAALVLLQLVGPILKRWSYHRRHPAMADSGPGCLVEWFILVPYSMMMLILSGTASILISEAIFKTGSAAENLGVFGLLAGCAWSVISVRSVYLYFVAPKRPPRRAFLTTPAAERLGDVCMYVNVIGLQILWVSLTASGPFREIVTSTPLGRPGTFSDVLGRIFVISVLAALVYFPGRIFYLVEDEHRKLTWLTMLLANLPLIVGIAFAPAGKPVHVT